MNWKIDAGTRNTSLINATIVGNLIKITVWQFHDVPIMSSVAPWRAVAV